MQAPIISIIITTSPQREANLKACLNQLTQQSFQDFEVLICDDGSEKGEMIAHLFENELNYQYYWRPNDLNPSISRNQGVQHSQGQFLVFLDSDIVLNPRAIEAYHALFIKFPEYIWSGYMGYLREYEAPSVFIPGRMVNYLDKRFHQYGYQLIRPVEMLRKEPGLLFWGGNIGMPKKVFEALNGFDEEFVGWGNEDCDFAFRALKANFQIHFCLDIWGEHLVHDYNEPFHQTYIQANSSGQRFSKEHPPVQYAVKVLLENQEIGQQLCHHILTHYVQQDSNIPPQMKSRFLNPEVRLLLRRNQNKFWEVGIAFPKGSN